ncbi:RNA polymerase sigma factor [Kitasatospora albolonga]
MGDRVGGTEEELGEEWSRFEAVYRASYPSVVRYLRRRLAAHLVDDAASEVFTIAWERWSTRRGAPLPWLYGIARRVAANVRRAQGAAARLVGRLQDEHPSSDSADEPAVEAQVLGRLGAAGILARIPDRDREVLMLVSWDGLEPHEAAQALGCGRAAFLIRLRQAVRPRDADSAVRPGRRRVLIGAVAVGAGAGVAVLVGGDRRGLLAPDRVRTVAYTPPVFSPTPIRRRTPRRRGSWRAQGSRTVSTVGRPAFVRAAGAV